MTWNRAERRAALLSAAKERILLLDGAMGTEIQALALTEVDFRGSLLTDHESTLKGNNDLLSLTQPTIIAEIHRRYLEAGSDILTSNSFNANRVSQADYGLQAHAYELNLQASRVARRAADAVSEKTPERPRFVAGVLGPTSRTASLSPDVSDPGYRNVTFDLLAQTYEEAARGLIDGGADLLLIETVFDTLNARAALFAVQGLLEDLDLDLPVMVSGTITDRSGRTLSGQTPEAFWISLQHAGLFSVGLNCALGPAELRPHLADLARVAETLVSAHPNAGLPNTFGGYDLGPAEMAQHLGAWARDGLLNLVGGCCGTTPAHISALSDVVAGLAPREIPQLPSRLRLSGLEPFELRA